MDARDWDPHFDRGVALYAPLQRALAPFRAFDRWPVPDEWNEYLPHEPVLRAASGKPVRFALQPPKTQRRRRGAIDVQTLYDERIYTEGAVPSRANDWHDFFNMLVWCSFPAMKCAVNARQRAALRARITPGQEKLPGARSREQDTLAMLDEGGILLPCTGDVTEVLREAVTRGDGETVQALARSGSVQPLLVGHAIYEHRRVRAGEGAVRAMAVVLPRTLTPGDDRETVQRQADRAIARLLERPDTFLAPADGRGLLVTDALFDAR